MVQDREIVAPEHCIFIALNKYSMAGFWPDLVISSSQQSLGVQSLTRLGHWADDRQAHIQDLVAATGRGKLPSLTPAADNPAVQKQVTLSR